MATNADELILRLINRVHYNPNAPQGKRLQPAHLPMNDCIPTLPDKGPSVYLKSQLKEGVKTLEAEFPKWRNYGYAEINVGDLTVLDVAVVHSPDNCPFPNLQHAHYSLVGIVTRELRDSVIAIIERGLVRAPQI